MNPSMTASSHKKIGPIVAILVVVLLLVIAALYLFASKLNSQSASNSSGNSEETAMASQSVAPVTNTSDDTNAIYNDLNSATAGVDSQNF